MYNCGRCGEVGEAWYTLSDLTKGLWVKCKKCGTHARSYVEGLQIPKRPSKSYKRVRDLFS